MAYKFARWFVKLILRLSSRLEMRGREKVPDTGSFVIASNHLGRLDPLLVYYILDRRDIIMLVAEKYRKIPLARWFVRQLNAMWVDRFNADFSAVREALTRLRKGGVLVLAPEGTRSPTGALIQARPGVSYLAAKAGVPIIPVALAAGLSPFEPERVALRAGRLMLEEIRRRVREGLSFAFETTLAGRNYARQIPRWRAAGYYVKLVFLSLPTSELAMARVAARAAQGGHDVPEEVVRRRFDAGFRNFESLYRGLVNSWVLYDNSGPRPRLLAEGENP